MSQNIQVGAYSVAIERPEASGSFLKATKDWTKEAKGAYDMMSLVKKLLLVVGDNQLAGVVGKYTDGTSVPYFFSLVAGLPSMLKETFSEKLTAYGAFKFTHNITEIVSMGMFTVSFFNPANTLAANTGVLFDALSDMTEVPTYAWDTKEAFDLLKLANKLEISGDVMSGLTSKLHFSLIKLAKSVMASLKGFFSSYTMVTGAALVSAATILAFSLGSTMCNVIGHYQQNYFADYNVTKISMVA